MSNRPQVTFMTGATGFLGSFLLRDLLASGRRVVAMVRPPIERSRRTIETAMSELGSELSSFIDSGQLTLVLGALPDDLPDCREYQPTELLSCAASLQLFSNGNEEPHRTNVVGVESLLDWVRRHEITSIHAVSTAYVCGSYTDGVSEVFHHPKPQFKTEYEKSKWHAEALFNEWSSEPGHVLTLYRPAFLVGDSVSGYTTQYGGFYQFARVVSLLKDRFRVSDNGERTHVPLRIPGKPDDPQNFVPVDFASRIITEVMADELLHGRIYHLTDGAPPTNDDIKTHLEDYFGLCGGYFTESAGEIRECSPAESLVWEMFDIAAERVAHNPHFRQDNTERVMSARGITFPALTRERFFTLLDYAVANRWGQRANGDGNTRA
jgi:nucleoside-diphosphate-sugar epimerase